MSLLTSLFAAVRISGGIKGATRNALRVIRTNGFSELLIIFIQISRQYALPRGPNKKSVKVGELPWLREKVEFATNLDPRVSLLPLSIRNFNSVSTPIETNSVLVLSQVLDALNGYRPDIAIWIPDLDLGGATTYAVNIATSLDRTFPNCKVLVIKTAKESNFVSVADGPYFKELTLNLDRLKIAKSEQSRFIYALSVNLCPKLHININSQPFWLMYETFGKALQKISKVAGTFFCEEFVLDESYQFPLKDRGLAMQFLSTSTPTLDYIFTDNPTFVPVQMERFGINKSNLDKIVCLKQPLSELKFVWNPPLKGERVRIAWAGRFVYQKGIDTALRLAERLSEIEFHVYGGDSKEIEQAKFPTNFVLHGTFSEFSEVLSCKPHIFLNTSRWDGFQIIFLEAVSANIPIVTTKPLGLQSYLVKEYDDVLKVSLKRA
jgi:glycosyltransferase involved in cell wall biosynthesis